MGVNSPSLGWRVCTQTRFKLPSQRKSKVAFARPFGSNLQKAGLRSKDASEGWLEVNIREVDHHSVKVTHWE